MPRPQQIAIECNLKRQERPPLWAAYALTKDGDMSKHIGFIVAAACTAALAASAAAQNAPNTSTIRADRQAVVKAEIIDTRALFPQIDGGFTLGPREHDNPGAPPSMLQPGSPNNLRAGQATLPPRGEVQGLFPGPSFTTWFPPDPDIAVGPNHVIIMVNESLAFYNKATGAQIFLQTNNAFWNTGANPFDPECWYDRIAGRYVMTAVTVSQAPNVSNLLIAVSDDNDPNGVWYKYTIDVRYNQGGVNAWSDYPHYGYNKDAYVMTSNLFPFAGGGAQGVYYAVLQKAPMLSGGATTVSYIRDAASFSSHPCEVIDNNFDVIHLVSANPTAGVLKVQALTNLTGTPVLNTTTVAVPTWIYPPRYSCTSTNGRVLDSLDGRMLDAIWRNGRIVCSHSVRTAATGSWVRCRWYELSTNNWPTSGAPSLVQSGEVGDNVSHHWMPSLNVNGLGDISMIFSRCSTSIPADIMYSGRMVGDPAGQMGAPQLLENSLGNNYSAQRWGDYFGVDVDPVDDTTFYGVAMDIDSSNNWRCSWFRWTISMPGILVPPASFSMVRGNVVSGGLPELLTSNDQYLVTRPGIVFSTSEAPIQIQVDGTSALTNANGLTFHIESNVNQGNINQTVELLNQQTNTYEQVDTRAATTSDNAIDITITTNPGRFVNTTTGAVRAKISYKAVGPIFSYPWLARIDHIFWRVSGT